MKCVKYVQIELIQDILAHLIVLIVIQEAIQIKIKQDVIIVQLEHFQNQEMKNVKTVQMELIQDI